MPRSWIFRSALALSAASLAACGMLDTGRKIEKPPIVLVSAPGTTVTVTDDQSGSPVDLRSDQQLSVRLRLAGTTQSDWTLVGFQPGVLTEAGPTRYEQDATSAKYGEVAGNQVWRFRPARPGQVALRFELRVPRSREPVTQTAAFDVTVH